METFVSEKSKISCSVVGARGYSGLEVSRLLMQHPHAKLTHCFATGAFRLSDYLSNAQAQSIQCLPDTEIMQNLTDVVFLATPAEVSLKLAPQILTAGKKVIDLSGAFRLKKNDYKKWYGFEHHEPAYLKEAHYGLAAWAGPSKGENLIANPGCYATAVTMALIPLLKSNIIISDSVVIDAKSGATGAGKKATENLLFTEVTEECLPYKVGRHQHYPEIIETLEAYTGKSIEAHFSTSLLPVRRGIIAAIYAQLAPSIEVSDVQNSFVQAYAENSLVSFAHMQERSGLVSLKKVVGTAKTHISYEVVGRRLYVFSCIDNLLKGAASQALENFNRISDLPIDTGLTHLEAQI
ncbi:MAG: N-acetyl-gamma-glutamyl-phosphate reductase [Pseudobdellovibrio sp.]